VTVNMNSESHGHHKTERSKKLRILKSIFFCTELFVIVHSVYTASLHLDTKWEYTTRAIISNADGLSGID
jgi:hypothetical protein